MPTLSISQLNFSLTLTYKGKGCEYCISLATGISVFEQRVSIIVVLQSEIAHVGEFTLAKLRSCMCLSIPQAFVFW